MGRPNQMKVSYLPIDDIIVNHEYQRGLKESHVASIDENFDLALLDPVRVWKRDDGKWEAWDGQHTLEMLRGRGWKAVPCFESNGSTDEQDVARMFVQRQRLRKPLRPLEIFKAELYSGNPRAVAIDKIAGEFGLHIGSGSSPNAVSAIKKVEKVFDSGPDHLRDVFRVITSAWSDDRDRLHGQMILGIHRYLVSEKPDSVSMDVFCARLVTKLSRVSPVEILRKAFATGYQDGGGNLISSAVESEIKKLTKRRRIAA